MAVKTVKVAFVFYFLAIVMSFLFALLFILIPQVPSYHLEIMGSEWHELNSGTQLLLLSFMRRAGWGSFSYIISLCVLLFIPFRQGHKWAYWALPAVAVSGALSSFIINYNLGAASGVKIPVVLPGIHLGFILLGLLFTLIGRSK